MKYLVKSTNKHHVNQTRWACGQFIAVEPLPWLDAHMRPAAPLLAPRVPPRSAPHHRMAHQQIYCSDKYFDEHCQYRHVMLPRELSKQVLKTHLMSEGDWRRLGVQQGLGWVHYMMHEPEPYILLFRRPLTKDQQK
ncbi:cyclin-dependent kinases regulatory subunit 2-like [Diceros bicornis minor]|uniref:cyclin-dependent kinases regulatory subunit 2-like n=1 Tax=Diceros bicornis minor TaxID=77932 RepID=UPI0026F29C54|nr:cyclin-dependent kinases regulatory subunit 2-like [Diceros bicornis minor]